MKVVPNDIFKFGGERVKSAAVFLRIKKCEQVKQREVSRANRGLAGNYQPESPNIGLHVKHVKQCEV